MKQPPDRRLLLVLILIFSILTSAGIAANTVITMRLSAQTEVARPRALPCEAVPVRLILEDAVCAQKLLNAMNVTTVRIAGGRETPGPAGVNHASEASQPKRGAEVER